MSDQAIREHGECVMYRWHHDDGTWDLLIERADPHVLISDQLLRELHTGEDDSPWAYLRPSAELKRADHCDILDCCDQRELGPCFMGAILTINAANQTVVYRIGKWINDAYGGTWGAGVWEASWPD